MKGYQGGLNSFTPLVAIGGGDSMGSFNKFLASRIDSLTGLEVVSVPPFSSVAFNVNGASPQFEQWSVVADVAGTVGTVDIYHGQESAQGRATLRLNVGGDSVTFRSSRSASGKWGIFNNTGSSVVVSLHWRESE